MWYCDGCKDKFETEKEALEHEKTCQEAIDFTKRQDEEKKLKEEIRVEEKRLMEEKRERERAAKLHSQNKTLEEEKELETFTYQTMKSDNRFPYLNTYIGLLTILATLVLFVGLIGGIFLLIEADAFMGVFILVYAIFTFIGLLVAAEIIRLLLDFHDNNHVSTKIKIETLKILEKMAFVKIETLETLEKISNKLDKPDEEA